MDLQQVWPDWKIEECIGEGAFGKVYRIVKEKADFGFSYQSALKAITIPSNARELESAKNEGMDEKSVTSFFYSMVEDIVEEIQLMYELRGNGHIVGCEDYKVIPHEESVGWDIYIRMELLTPLYQYLKTHPMTMDTVAKLGIDICKALEDCHKKKIVHRDIKPENIFVTDTGKFKLGDFGIARQMERTVADMSKKGTYVYMAPEVYKGEKYGASVDIYSLGIVLYRLLNDNRAPFMPPYPQQITYENKMAANQKRFMGEQMPLPAHAKNQLGAIILKTCAYDMAERYASATELRGALELFLRMRGTGDGEQTELLPAIKSVFENEQKKSHKTAGIEKSVSKVEDTIETLDDDKTEAIDLSRDAGTVYKVSPNESDMYEAKKTQAVAKNRQGRKVAGICAATAVIVVGISALVGLGRSDKNAKAASAGEVQQEETKADEEIENNIKVQETVVQNSIAEEPETYNLPAVEGQSARKAVLALENAGFRKITQKYQYSDTVKKGLVISQLPDAGVCDSLETEITLFVSDGKELIETPNVTGISQKKAISKLKKAGFTVKRKLKYSSKVAFGNVIKQSVKAGEKVEPGAEVLIVVSRGKKPQPVSSNEEQSSSSGTGSGSGSSSTSSSSSTGSSWSSGSSSSSSSGASSNNNSGNSSSAPSSSGSGNSSSAPSSSGSGNSASGAAPAGDSVTSSDNSKKSSGEKAPSNPNEEDISEWEWID